MKKVLAITLMLLLCATVAMAASQTSWRVLLKADNGAGSAAGPGAYVGVYPTSLEGLDGQDGAISGAIGADVPGTAAHVLAVVPGMPDLYGKTIKAPTEPLPEKTWDLYLAGNASWAGTPIRILAYTVNAALPPAEWLPTQPAPMISYWLRLVNNKGVEGAPANGTEWSIPIPTVHVATAYWTIPVSLPSLKLSTKSNGAMLAEGYKLQFVEKCVVPIVPEPSGMLALGVGLMGLVGFVTRRRK